MRALPLLPAATILLTACGAPGSGEYLEVAGVESGLHGTYRMETVNKTLVEDDKGNRTTKITRLNFIAFVDQHGESVKMRVQPCSIAVPEVSGKTPEIPNQILAKKPPMDIAGQLVRSGDTLELNTDPFAITAGLKLNNPITDELPTDPKSPLVFDEDGDGKPGITVKSSYLGITVQVYLGLRMRSELHALITAPADPPATEAGGDPATVGITVAGTLQEFGLNVQTYGGKFGWFGLSQATIDQFKAKNHVVDSDNTFTLTPAPELKTCADLGTK